MKENLKNSSKLIDKQKLAAIAAISKVATSLKIPFFLIGASARDILLQKNPNIPIYRATLDIDFGVKVSSWDEYTKLKKSLIKTGNFVQTREDQRLKYKDHVIIDLIPFGNISDEDLKIRWPRQEMFMNILGFEEAFRNAQTVKLRSNPVLELKLVTLAGLAIMKIIAWSDRYPERRKDAEDFFIIMYNYTDVGNFERIYNELPDLLESDDFDYVGAGARLLGRDIAKILSMKTKEKILEILNKETGKQDRYRLIEDIMRSDSARSSSFERIFDLLEDLKTGISET